MNHADSKITTENTREKTDLGLKMRVLRNEWQHVKDHLGSFIIFCGLASWLTWFVAAKLNEAEIRAKSSSIESLEKGIQLQKDQTERVKEQLAEATLTLGNASNYIIALTEKVSLQPVAGEKQPNTNQVGMELIWFMNITTNVIPTESALAVSVVNHGPPVRLMVHRIYMDTKTGERFMATVLAGPSPWEFEWDTHTFKIEKSIELPMILSKKMETDDLVSGLVHCEFRSAASTNLFGRLTLELIDTRGNIYAKSMTIDPNGKGKDLLLPLDSIMTIQKK